MTHRIFYFVVFGCHLLEASSSLLKRDRKRVDQDGKGVEKRLGGVEGGETKIRIYCMRKKYKEKIIINK